MKSARTLGCASFCLGLAAAAAAQMPPVPQPGPEHALLKADEGVWDATVEMLAAPPGTPVPPPAKGSETNTLIGGLWLVTDFKSDFMGAPFSGHGINGWDATKKKYVSVWTDTMSSGLMRGEASYDAAKKTMTGWMEGPDVGPHEGPNVGQAARVKVTTEYKDADTRVFTMYAPGSTGKEPATMRITYKRRK